MRFANTEVHCLGFVVVLEGIKLGQRKIEATQQFPQPTTVQEICRFVGLASNYRHFIDHFVDIAAPSHANTRADVDFSRTEDCQKVFCIQKIRLTSPPVVAYSDFNQEFSVKTDASDLGRGAILTQGKMYLRMHPDRLLRWKRIILRQRRSVWLLFGV